MEKRKPTIFIIFVTIRNAIRRLEARQFSYTTGVPAMCGALMMLTGKWIRPGVYTVEEFDPDPFLEALDKYGLPRSEIISGAGGLMEKTDTRPPFAASGGVIPPEFRKNQDAIVMFLTKQRL